jgi:hypothetical protein
MWEPSNHWQEQVGEYFSGNQPHHLSDLQNVPRELHCW